VAVWPNGAMPSINGQNGDAMVTSAVQAAVGLSEPSTASRVPNKQPERNWLCSCHKWPGFL